MKKNLDSRGVMEKLDLRFVGEYREELFPVEDKAGVRYEVRRGEWEERRRTPTRSGGGDR
jgi:hypothetical protein